MLMMMTQMATISIRNVRLNALLITSVYRPFAA